MERQVREGGGEEGVGGDGDSGLPVLTGELQDGHTGR